MRGSPYNQLVAAATVKVRLMFVLPAFQPCLPAGQSLNMVGQLIGWQQPQAAWTGNNQIQRQGFLT